MSDTEEDPIMEEGSVEMGKGDVPVKPRE